jgi:hypothetical protein
MGPYIHSPICLHGVVYYFYVWVMGAQGRLSVSFLFSSRLPNLTTRTEFLYVLLMSLFCLYENSVFILSQSITLV